MNKHEQRKQALALRNSLDGALRRRWSLEICDRLYAFEPLKQAKTIAAYYPLGSEVDLVQVLKRWEAEGKRIVLPISFADGTMEFRTAEMARLEQGLYGIWQPTQTAPLVTASEMDAVLIPGAAFDAAGGRIGYGKGYYDRFFRSYQGLTIGVCFAVQRIANVRMEPHDVPIQYLAEEKGIYRTKKEEEKEKQNER